MNLCLFQWLSAAGAEFTALFVFGLAVGAFLLFGCNHDHDHDHKNDNDCNSDPNENTQSERYETEAAQRAFILFIHRGLFFRCLVRFAGVLLCTAAV